MNINFTLSVKKTGLFELLAIDLNTYEVHAKYLIHDTKRGYQVTAFDGEQWITDSFVQAQNECVRDCKMKKGWK